MAAWIKIPLGREAGLGPSDTVLDGNPAPPPRKKWGHSPQFSAHVYCSQTAGWIKMPLGVELGLGPGHIVLDGTQLPSPKRGHTPNFRPMSTVHANGCMDQDATWCGIRPRPRSHYARRGPSPPPKREHSPSPIFGRCPLWPNGRPSHLLLSICC